MLRLDYFLGLGLELSEGDIIIDADNLEHAILTSGTTPDVGDNAHIKHFAERENLLGKIPCPKDLVVTVTLRDGVGNSASADSYDWDADPTQTCFDIITWKPTLSALVKQQNKALVYTKEMNLYLLEQDENKYYDTYDSIIVAAVSEEEARVMHPHYGDKDRELYNVKCGGVIYCTQSWASPEGVEVTLLGTSVEKEPCVVHTSFCAG